MYNVKKFELSISDLSHDFYFSNPGGSTTKCRPVSRQSKSMNESEVGLLIRGRVASSRRN